MRVVYLHGFASSPESGKARYFTRRFSEAGIALEIPRLVPGEFEHITISGQLQVLEETIHQEPVLLIGSSLGGYLAALYASKHAQVEKLVLMAPAFHFPKLWPDTGEWQRTGVLPVFHYGFGREMNVGWSLMEDARQHDPEPAFPQPALIFHGKRDAVVPPQSSTAFARKHSNVTLRLFDSDHQLSDVVDEMWDLMQGFLFETRGAAVVT